MFEKEQMKRIVALQEKSFALFRWLNHAMVEQRVKLDAVHEALGLSAAAEQWVRAHFLELPDAVRPEKADIPAFAHLFASYLSTSYTVADKRVASDCGCYCELCRYLVSVRHLRPRIPTKKARREARELKTILLRRLAADAGVDLASDTVDEMLADQGELGDAISWATYGQELIRRSQFASQGEGVLVLWREIAWDDKGKVRRGFVLTPEAFMDAEKTIRDYLTRM